MNFKTTYILFAALVAALLLFGAAQFFKIKKPGETSAYVLASLHAGKEPVRAKDIDTITIQRFKPKAETLQFARGAHGWELQQPYQLHVENSQVDRLVNQVIDARKDKADLVNSLNEYGLDSPTELVTLRKGADQEWRLNLGTQSPGEASAVVYVTSSDQSKEPMAVKRSELDMLFKNVNDFRSKDLLGASSLNTTYVNVQETKHDPIIMEKTKEGRWRFEKPAYGYADFEGDTTPITPAAPDATKPITGVKELLDAIGDLRVPVEADFLTADASDSDLANYGLERGKPQRMRIEIKRSAGVLGGDEPKEPVQEALLIGKPVEVKADKKAGEDQAMVYVRLESEKAISKIPAKHVEAIAKVAESPAALRNRDLVQIEQARTDAIDIQNASGLIKLRKPQATWKLTADKGAERNADDPTVQGLLTVLRAKRQVQSFPDPAKESEMGFDKPQAVLSLWVDGLQKEDKKDEGADDKKEKKDDKKDSAEPKLKTDKPTVQLTFGKKDKDVVYVRRQTEDEKIVLAVPQTLLSKVDQGFLAYLDRALPSFSESADVTALLLQRGGETFDLTKDKDTWKLNQPKSLAGRTADLSTVDNILRQLRSLQAVRLVKEKAEPAVLKEYALEPAALKATVKVKGKEDKPEEWVYQFGKETEDKAGVYAKMNHSDLVFAVSSTVPESLRADLRDTTVFHFDAAKIKGLKLTGWKQVLGATFTLDLERKGTKTWTAKAPPDFDVDGEQAETFASGLADLKADRFVVHPFDAKDRTLQVEVTVEGEAPPLTLTLGGFDAKEKSYNAQSSKTGNEVFLFPQSRFEKMLQDGPKYFSKKAK